MRHIDVIINVNIKFPEVPALKYTVLVVEDEINQRRALVERVEWEKAGFEVIGQAENGAEALDKVEQLEPDLIFTDIKMPLISGLELAAKVRELRPATQIVILSGYDSFEYARTAINYNIISYLLKPISSSELSEQLFDIHRRMEERLGGISGKTAQTDSERLNRLTVIEFLQPLMFGGSEQQSGDDEKLKAAAAQLGITDENKRNKFCVLVSKFKKDGKNSVSDEHAVFVDKILGRYLKKAVTFITYGRAVTLAVFEETDIPQNVLELALLELVQTSKRVMDEECTVGISRQFYELSHCPTAYFEAVTARRYTSDGVGHIRYIEDKERDGEVEFEYVEKSVLKIEQLLKVGNADELGEFINDMYENNTPENANLLVVQIIATVCRVVSNASDKSELSGLVAKNPIFSRITSYSSQSGMRDELTEFCRDAKKDNRTVAETRFAGALRQSRADNRRAFSR